MFLGCETYEVLRDRQLGPIEKEFPRFLFCRNDKQSIIRQTAIHGLCAQLLPEFGGGILQLRNLDDENKRIGAESYAMGVDQIEKNPVEVFDGLRGNLRWPGVPKPRFMSTANPGIGVGLPWVKALWVDRSPPERMRALLPEVILVEGRPGDNPHLDAAYWEDLRTQPAHIVKAWLEGDWSVIEGAAFPEWQARRKDAPWHVIPTGKVPEGAKCYLGVDWGFGAPWACYLIAVAHDGRLTLCRELYGKGVKTSDQGEAKLSLLAAEGLHPDNVLAYCGFDVFARRLTSAGTYEEPIVSTWQKQGLRCVQAGRDPKHRASKFREFLRDWGPDEGWPDGRPGIAVMDCCGNFIRTAPLLQLDPKNPEVVNTKMEDHPYDGAGHVWVSMPTRPKIDDAFIPDPRSRRIKDIEAIAAEYRELVDPTDKGEEYF